MKGESSERSSGPLPVERLISFAKIGVGVWIGGCTLVFCVGTWHWPLVNDAALLHYVSFLIDHGLKPYRDILDPNIAGSYLVDWTVIHTLGAGALDSRLYDLLLLLMAGVGMLAIGWRRSRFAALYAACLFALFHGRDGMAQIGQRDLAVAVGLLAAIAFATVLSRRASVSLALGFGFAIGLATTIKPYALLGLLLLIPLVPLLPRCRRGRVLWAVLAGWMVPLCVLAVYLVHEGVVQPFLFVLFTIDPLHGQLGFPGVWYLVKWCLPPSLLVMAGLGFLVMGSAPAAGRSIERSLLLVGMVVGLIAYFEQMKGFPYHRYPLVACLLLFVAFEFTEAIGHAGRLCWIGVAGLLFGAVLAPIYLGRALHSKWPNDMEVTLEQDLNSMGGERLNGKIQCIDSINGCTRVMYDMGLVESTGVMYDEFLFVSHPSREIVARRDEFLKTIESREPAVIVITPDLFPSGPKADAKLLMWPEFSRFLSDCYDEEVQRDFPTGAPSEPGYRLYVASARCRGAKSRSSAIHPSELL